MTAPVRNLMTLMYHAPSCHTPFVPSPHGIPRKAQGTRGSPQAPSAELDDSRDCRLARRLQVVGLPLGSRCSVHAVEAPVGASTQTESAVRAKGERDRRAQRS